MYFRKRAQRKLKEREIKAAVKGAAAGLGIGATAALLFAPKSGKETREDIATGCKKVKNKANKTLHTVEEKIEIKARQAKEKVEEKIEEAVEEKKETKKK